MNKQQKEFQKRIVQIVKSKMIPLKKKTRKHIVEKLNSFLDNNSTGILILSDFNEEGKTDLKISIIRTHEEHTKETFKQLFQREPNIRQIIDEIIQDEKDEEMKLTRTMVN